MIYLTLAVGLVLGFFAGFATAAWTASDHYRDAEARADRAIHKASHPGQEYCPECRHLDVENHCGLTGWQRRMQEKIEANQHGSS